MPRASSSRCVAARLQTRFTPVLTFKRDDSVKKSIEMSRLIDDALPADRQSAETLRSPAAAAVNPTAADPLIVQAVWSLRERRFTEPSLSVLDDHNSWLHRANRSS